MLTSSWSGLDLYTWRTIQSNSSLTKLSNGVGKKIVLEIYWWKLIEIRNRKYSVESGVSRNEIILQFLRNDPTQLMAKSVFLHQWHIVFISTSKTPSEKSYFKHLTQNSKSWKEKSPPLSYFAICKMAMYCGLHFLWQHVITGRNVTFYVYF